MNHLVHSTKTAFGMGLVGGSIAAGYSLLVLTVTANPTLSLLNHAFIVVNVGGTVASIAGMTGFICLLLPTVFYPYPDDKPLTHAEARRVWQVALAVVLVAAGLCLLAHWLTASPASAWADVASFYVPMLIAFGTPALVTRWLLRRRTFLHEIRGHA